MTAKQTDILTTADVSRMLDVTTETVRSMNNSGRLLAMRTPGGQRLFRKEDVERFAAKRAKDKRGKRGPTPKQAVTKKKAAKVTKKATTAKGSAKA